MDMDYFVKKFCEDWGIDANKINNGYCYDFADMVQSSHPEYKVYDIDGDRIPAHACLEKDGVFYDSDCVNGVVSWRKLPLYKSQSHLLETYKEDIVIRIY